MKRLLFLFIVLAMIISARAQVETTDTPSGRFLVKGDNIVGLHAKFSGSVGKNKFESIDNTRKPSDFSVSLGTDWERMISNNWALGGFLEYDVDIQKDKEQDTKFTSNTFVLGPMATAYKPCGKLENGGFFGMVSLGGGVMTNSYTFQDDKQKDPVGGVLTGQLDFGGYYLLNDDWMLSASLAMFGFTTEFMNGDGSTSDPDMVSTDFRFGVKDFIPRIGVSYKY